MKNLKQFICIGFFFHLVAGPLLAISTPSHLVAPHNAPPVMVEGYFLNKGAGQMPLEDFLALTPKKYHQQTGQKLGLKERIVLKFAQKSLKRQLKKGEPLPPVVNLNLVEHTFNWGAFALGFFLGLIGLLIVILAFKDKKAWISALIGLGVALAFLLLLVSLISVGQV